MAEHPSTARECRDRAASCERLARSATPAKNREIMQYLANRWRLLAEEEEAKLHSPEPRVRSRPSGGMVGSHEDSE